MTRIQLLAAEVFAYSFDHYSDHLGIGHVRFEQTMPETVRQLAQAEKEQWTDARLAEALEVDISEVAEWRKRYQNALEVVDAPTPAASFRNAVRQVIARELGRHPLSDVELETAVTQICYRAADLSYLLKQRNEPLFKYSSELRSGGASYH